MAVNIPRWKRSALPGFGLTAGITLVYLSLVVLFPLGVLILRASALGPIGIWRVAIEPRVLAALRTTFGISFAAAVIDLFFGGIVAGP
jgi:sulfate/thiosulfate transport system permease protein